MARLVANGQCVARLKTSPLLEQAPDIIRRTETHTLSFHANGHVLVNRGLGWKQFCIVPTWGIGSVIDWYMARGYITVEV